MPTILERYQKAFPKDQELAQQANKVLPDGITSDGRYMEPFPIYIKESNGSKKWGVSGQEFIDYRGGNGALLLGHNPPEIVAAVTKQLQLGTHYSACHPLEIEWANLIQELIPSAEKVRFTNSGTEANLLAIRLARTYTGKNKILRFLGHYHGWQDSVILGAGEGENTPSGIPSYIASQTIACPPNDLDIVEKYLREDPDIACIILEPTGGCSGVVPITGQFLAQLRELTLHYGVVLIFDEIITGFRVHPGGAQTYHQITPDLTTLAKVVAGGLPGGAVAGRQEILNLISKKVQKKTLKSTKVSHLGTFNANPVSASAGIAMLTAIKTRKPHKHINELANYFRQQLNQIIDDNHLDWVVYGEFSCLKFLIGHGLKGLKTADFNPHTLDYRKLMYRGNPYLRQYLRLGLLLNGIDISLSSVIMAAHSTKDIDQTVTAFSQTIAWLKTENLI
ncbi:Glutamate-1-semialdehyde 2,1-aminomutase [[Leptolyngbya] sp. PCC 7376]|uniref:aspartate aminotransferase family protein n=1 Tax=[Leptolyngbya] sp. PCC 7376 TaxID=111781 RepID=UPI00029ED9AC|nr:aspartate aminotransferase family protein [[Leptolyngbya] sp. PCC 7376]AFY40093.1 Glutamate-1-semialdehyde 2,1-aminomutase [[Leptolyngbya] sp. PCC 7376]